MVGAATGNNVMSRNRVEISYFILIPQAYFEGWEECMEQHYI